MSAAALESSPRETPERPVLLTGASGALGRRIATYLGGLGWTLRLTDLAAYPEPLPAGVSFERADLEDGVAILRQAEGCGTILHFGGVSTEHPFEAVLGPNLRGAFHVYEAARREQARVVFASSNHSIGFHERNEPLDDDCSLLPDTFYGLSKAYTELMGRMYWLKHAVETVAIRIGSCFPEPVEARMLSTWLSYDDLCRLCERATLADAVGNCVIWGASDNRATFWRRDARADLGWLPQDSADPFAGRLAAKTSGNPVIERYQGGSYAAMGYTRTAPSPR